MKRIQNFYLSITNHPRSVATGIVEKVPFNKLDSSDVHYLPHHGVVQSDKEMAKLRVVFDGSEKENESTCSINNRLETGPNFMPSLFETIVKFRCYLIALTSDIEKALLQIEIKPDLPAGAADEEKSYKIYKSTKRVLKCGGFNL